MPDVITVAGIAPLESILAEGHRRLEAGVSYLRSVTVHGDVVTVTWAPLMPPPEKVIRFAPGEAERAKMRQQL